MDAAELLTTLKEKRRAVLDRAESAKRDRKMAAKHFYMGYAVGLTNAIAAIDPDPGLIQIAEMRTEYQRFLTALNG